MIEGALNELDIPQNHVKGSRFILTNFNFGANAGTYIPGTDDISLSLPLSDPVVSHEIGHRVYGRLTPEQKKTYLNLLNEYAVQHETIRKKCRSDVFNNMNLLGFLLSADDKYDIMADPDESFALVFEKFYERKSILTKNQGYAKFHQHFQPFFDGMNNGKPANKSDFTVIMPTLDQFPEIAASYVRLTLSPLSNY